MVHVIFTILMGFAVLAGITSLVVFVFTRGHEKKREGALRLWAESCGMTFHETMNEADPQFRHIPLFQAGRSRQFRNVMRGRVTINAREHRVLLAYFWCRSGQGNNDTSSVYSIVAIETPYTTPDLAIRREGLLNRAVIAMGMEDIDVEDALFSKTFHVTSNDRRFAYALLAPRVIEHLMLWRRGIGAKISTVEVCDGAVLIHRHRFPWRSPAQFDRILRFGAGFIDRWPDHLLARFEGDPTFRTGVTISNEELRGDR